MFSLCSVGRLVLGHGYTCMYYSLVSRRRLLRWHAIWLSHIFLFLDSFVCSPRWGETEEKTFIINWRWGNQRRPMRVCVDCGCVVRQSPIRLLWLISLVFARARLHFEVEYQSQHFVLHDRKHAHDSRSFEPITWSKVSAKWICHYIRRATINAINKYRVIRRMCSTNLVVAMRPIRSNYELPPKININFNSNCQQSEHTVVCIGTVPHQPPSSIYVFFRAISWRLFFIVSFFIHPRLSLMTHAILPRLNSVCNALAEEWNCHGFTFTRPPQLPHHVMTPNQLCHHFCSRKHTVARAAISGFRFYSPNCHVCVYVILRRFCILIYQFRSSTLSVTLTYMTTTALAWFGIGSVRIWMRVRRIEETANEQRWRSCIEWIQMVYALCWAALG